MRIPVAATIAAGDLTSPMGVVPCDGTVVAVRYVPTTVLTGAATDSRTINLYNRLATGAGTTLVATKAFLSGINIAASSPGEITKSATAANLKVIAGQVLDWESLHVGSTGLIDPGGLAEVDILPDRHGRGVN
jgi:hypothetical protein